VIATLLIDLDNTLIGNDMEDFIQDRKRSIIHLTTLSTEDWSRSTRHSLFGPTTLAEVVNIATEHDLIHLAQMRSALGGKGD